MNLAEAIVKRQQSLPRRGLGVATSPSAVDVRGLVTARGFTAGIDLAIAQIRLWNTGADTPERRAVARDVLFLAIDYAAKAEQLLDEAASSLLAGVVAGAPIILAIAAANNISAAVVLLVKAEAPYRRFRPGDPRYEVDNRYLERISLKELQAICIDIMSSARVGFAHYDEFRSSFVGKFVTLGNATMDLLGAIIDLAATLAKALAVAARGLGVLAKILLYGAPVILVAIGGYWVWTKVGRRGEA